MYPTGRAWRLDALRGVAVLLVMAHHQVFPGVDQGLSGGWLGVDLFFVLSGYLIASLMLQENAATGSVARLRFAARRVRRLAPALLVLLVVWTVAATLPGSPVHGLATWTYFPGDVIAPGWLATLTGSTNWWLIAHQPYPVMFGHLWSLAVEWQFYLVAAVALPFVLARRPSRAVLAGALAAVLVVTAAQAAWAGTETGYYSMYLSTIGRVPALAGGVLIAVLSTRALPGEPWLIPPRLVVPAAFAALLPLAWAWMLADKASTVWLAVGLPLVAVADMTLLAAAVSAGATDTDRFARAWAWLSWCGRRSYGAYLWNFPVVLVLGRVAAPRLLGPEPTAVEWAGVVTATFAITWLLAVVSWWTVERWFLPPGSRA